MKAKRYRSQLRTSCPSVRNPPPSLGHLSRGMHTGEHRTQHSSRRRLHPWRVPSATALESLVDLAATLGFAQRISLRTLGCRVPHHVCGDADNVGQIATNLSPTPKEPHSLITDQGSCRRPDRKRRVADARSTSPASNGFPSLVMAAHRVSTSAPASRFASREYASP